MQKQELKQKIITELNKDNIPDFDFLFSSEVLDISKELLEELLEDEKKDFYWKLEIKNEDITFETFEEFSVLDFFYSALNHLLNIKSDDKIRNLIEEFEPKLVDFWNEVAYSKRFFEMIVYCRENWRLNNEQERILDEDIKTYKVRWIDLEKEKQEELKKINKRLRELSQKMWNNTLDSENEFSYFLDDDKFLLDLPKDVLETAKQNANKENKKWYLFDSSDSFYINIMKFCSSSVVRKYFYEERSKFASSWKYDNREVILNILKLRDKKAKILWFKNYSELSLVFKMAESPKQIKDLLLTMSSRAKKKAIVELDEIKTYFKIDQIELWDLGYYNRILKEEKYSFDEKELKNYFEFSDVIKGLHEITNKLYSIELKEMKNKSYNENVVLYEVYKDSKFISYFLTDYFYRPKKRSWAWMNNLRWKFFQDNCKKYPIVLNVANFSKWKDNTLLTMWEVRTLFHEFGHAIHEMLTKSKYSDLAANNIEWDFVELPSQIHENWAKEKESTNLFAQHIKTWEKIPDDMFKKLEKLEKFWTWNFYLRQNEFALLDMILHSEKVPENVDELDKKTLEISNNIWLFKRNKDYKQYTSFTHIFDWWYAAWYYSYVWAEIIEADIWTEFNKNWIFDKETSKRFLETILSKWSTKEAKDLFKDFMWREVSLDWFYERQGF